MKDRFRIPMFTDKGTFAEFQYIELGEPIECTLCGYNGEPQQCTGIQDKKGNFIYEGDIIKFYFDNDEILGVISWSYDDPIGFYINTTDYFKDKYITDYDFLKEEYEIIGNIHQNKELLEK